MRGRHRRDESDKHGARHARSALTHAGQHERPHDQFRSFFGLRGSGTARGREAGAGATCGAGCTTGTSWAAGVVLAATAGVAFAAGAGLVLASCIAGILTPAPATRRFNPGTGVAVELTGYAIDDAAYAISLSPGTVVLGLVVLGSVVLGYVVPGLPVPTLVTPGMVPVGMSGGVALMALEPAAVELTGADTFGNPGGMTTGAATFGNPGGMTTGAATFGNPGGMTIGVTARAPPT
jgi:hypothetical protein